MLFNDERTPKCGLCKEIHARKVPPEQPPCEEQCQKPILDAANEETASVFMTCRGQVITAGMGQVIDIDLQAVKVMCDVLDIKDQAKVIQRVRKLFFKCLDEQKNPSARDDLTQIQWPG